MIRLDGDVAIVTGAGSYGRVDAVVNNAGSAAQRTIAANRPPVTVTKESDSS
jgi:NADP-dependent 3-hydroxy acid dehydrogenase YdfG